MRDSSQTDSDRVRGFPAFGAAKRGRGHFARSWWGKAWIKAMEDTALDQQPLKNGRRYAYAGRVGTITVSPGRLAAVVDSGPEGTFRTVVSIAQLTDTEWANFLDRVTSRAGHIAALLDKDMPHDLVDAAEDAGIQLLPGIGDLEPDCDCPDWELPCQHAAALCYQTSWLLDSDPFVLLLLRGRGERELLDELHVRHAPQPRSAPAEINADALAALVASAADRARAYLAGTASPRDLRRDAVRMAATQSDSIVVSRLRAASDDQAAEFDRAVRAWSYGGPAGLAVLESTWTPPKPAMARAQLAWADTWEGDDARTLEAAKLEVVNNWCTAHSYHLQVRLGRDGRWYPYREEAGEWWPAGPPDNDPAAVFARQLD
jgi:uncharacterized Zn finger protein